jgi:hypothetical protein
MNEMESFQVRKPSTYRLVPQVNAERTEHVFCVEMLEPIPPLWSVVFGEAIHNLCSALDHCVWHLYVDRNRQSRKGTHFPIYVTDDDFRKHGRDAIRGIGPGPKAFIKSLQPYPERNETFHRSLADLVDFWNQDKHRLVHLWGVLFDLSEVEYPIGTFFDPVGGWRVLHDHAEVFRIITKWPVDKVEVSGPIEARVAIEHFSRKPSGERASLWDLHADVARIIDALLGSLGRQDDTISPVWPVHGLNAPPF